jgi:UPF0755 protein
VIVSATKGLRILAVGVVVAVVGIGATLLWVFFGPNTFAGESEKTFYVSQGKTFSAIVDSLESAGVIRSRPLFVFVAKLLGGTRHLHAGKYLFPSGISNFDLVRWLQGGKGTVFISVTIREGIRSQTEARIFANALGLDSARYVSLVHDGSFIRSLGIDAPSLEGYLLPETYRFPWEPGEKDVIRQQVEQFQEVYSDSLKARAKALGWNTNQVLTMASIVEGEALLDEERPIISGVYHNRLRKRMRLEADPTIQFIIEGGPRRLLYSDLRRDSPYNTYLHAGLPPGPVNNPGKASILAALYPARHNYLYFVADGKGGHWFSESYAGHSRNVRKYKKVRAEYQFSLGGRSNGP